MSLKTLAYNQSLGLATDLYELTMAYGYWKTGIMDREAVFHLTFRDNPFKGGFTIACGLEYALDYIGNFKFDPSDIEYLETLKTGAGTPLFEKGFLDYLSKLKAECSVDAVPEGTVVFPHEPLIRVQGPHIQCQILETPLLNMINFQSLIATKAARVYMAARGESVLEFGLRRAQGFDGALAASRAAYIGGCSATSNVLAGKIFGIPVRGTHAHSWVMSFDNELESFMAYAKAMPDNCIFLVDTYNTIEGIKHAVEAGLWLRENGHKLIGIRLDSGDLSYLSRKAREMLDNAGFRDAVILGSNELDENIIASLKDQGAQIAVWGVGTKLVTGYDQPALNGIYKLSAIRKPGRDWEYRLKLSEQSVKISTPGILQVRRFSDEENIADVIYNTGADLNSGCTMIDPLDSTRQKKIPAGTAYRDLLVPVIKNGKRVYPEMEIGAIRNLVIENMKKFHDGIKRFVNPHIYPVGLEKSLYEMRTKMIMEKRAQNHLT
jgi:nicotinate phosphoribosyltransferase